MTNYEAAREKYAALGVDTDKAIETLKKVPVSLHCWQLDDVIGLTMTEDLLEAFKRPVIIWAVLERRNS